MPDTTQNQDSSHIDLQFLPGSVEYVDQVTSIQTAEQLELIRITTPQGVVMVEEGDEDPDAEDGAEFSANSLYGTDEAISWLVDRASQRRGASALPLDLYSMSAIDFKRWLDEPDCQVEVPFSIAAEIEAILSQEAEDADAQQPAILRSIGEGEPEPSASDVLASESWQLLDGLALVSMPVLDSVTIDSSEAIERLTETITMEQGKSMEGMTTMAKIAHAGNLHKLSDQLELRQRLPMVTIQNRDRASSESAAQIQRMAMGLDIDWLGASSSPLSGCPIVFFDYDAWQNVLPAGQMGSTELVRMPSTGREIQTIYALLPAGVLLCSHDHMGLPCAGYELSEAPDRARAVAGNGRAAALQYAMAHGLPSTTAYRAGLKAVADSIGLDPGLADSMPMPVLVRVMHHADLVADIGVETNTPAA